MTRHGRGAPHIAGRPDPRFGGGAGGTARDDRLAGTGSRARHDRDHAGAAAGDRAGAAAQRLGPLGADRGRLRPHAARVLLPLLVQGRGRGDRERPLRQRRAAGLQPRRRPAAGRRDDRQGDSRGASQPPAAVPHRRALLQGLSRLLDADPEDRRRRGAPRERAPAALRRAPARARLPRGPQGHREALPRPLPVAALRSRRLRRGGDACGGAAGPDLRGRGGGGDARLRPGGRPAAAHGPDLLPDHPDVPLARAPGDARLPAGQVQDPLPGADRHSRARWGGGGRGQGVGADPGPGDPRPDPGGPPRDAREAEIGLARDEHSRAERGARRAGGAERTSRLAACSSPGSPPTGAAAWRRPWRASSTSRRSSASTVGLRRASSSAPSS